MYGRFGPPRRIKAPSAKSLVSLIYVIHIDALERAKDTIPSVAGDLQLGTRLRQVCHPIRRLTIGVFGPFALKIEHFCVGSEPSGLSQRT